MPLVTHPEEIEMTLCVTPVALFFNSKGSPFLFINANHKDIDH